MKHVLVLPAALVGLTLLTACGMLGQQLATAEATPLPTDTPPPTPTETEPAPEGAGQPGQPATPAPVEQVAIYLIALNDGGERGEPVGCGDSVVPVEIEIEPTREPLEAAIAALLAIDEETVSEAGLYNALHQLNLRLDEVQVKSDGTAIIALSGQLLIRGECDPPRVVAQLEKTALQFAGVTGVEVIINGEPLGVVLEELPPPEVTPTAPLVERVAIYLIALEDAGRSGEEVGCGDSVVPVEIEIEPTAAPLRAAMEQLVSIRDEFYGQSGLYNALHFSELTVQNVELFDDGTAVINLAGYVEFGGECDLPRFEAQLEKTALQFPTVQRVQIFINGQPLEVITGSAGRDEAGLDRVTIFLIALDDGGQQGEYIGCGDSVVPVEVPIEPTQAPLRTALEGLLAVDTDFYLNTGLYNALYQSDLSLDSVTIRPDGTAVVHLSGRLLLGGTCDAPRVVAQLEKTVLQFETVSAAEITVNGVPLREAVR